MATQPRPFRNQRTLISELTRITLGPGGDLASLEGSEREEERVGHDDVVVDGNDEGNDDHGGTNTCEMDISISINDASKCYLAGS